MKKNLIKGMVALCVCALFASCSKDPGFETPSEIEIVKNQYKENFIKKYGPIDPNQSWDFTHISGNATRAAGDPYSMDVIRDINLAKTFAKNDKNEIKAVNYNKSQDNSGYRAWNPNLAVTLTPAFSCATPDENPNINYSYYHLGVVYNGVEEDMTANINAKYNSWYDISGSNTLNHASRRVINTQDAAGIFWVAYPTASGRSQATTDFNNAVNAVLTTRGNKYMITDYKEVTVSSGRTYWCFDCNADGIYSDVICLAEDADVSISKRYMVEDLGSSKDFDFNDIVVDVIQDASYNQKAIVRAMGGTLDFILKIGDKEWSKSGANFEVTTMYNTEPTPEWNKVLAEFDVTGWNPSTNNITVTVKDKVSGEAIITIPFPRTGDVPMIIAVTPTYCDWMLERVSLPDDWYVITEDGEGEEGE